MNDFPLSIKQIKASCWTGHIVQSSGVVICTITDSVKSPGSHLVRVCGSDASQTDRPVPADLVPYFARDFLLRRELLPEQLKWRETNECPLDAMEDSSGHVVYFLKAGPFVKIGKATNSASSRVAALQTGCPYKIEIIGEMPGSYWMEARLHRHFAHLRAHGEWFHETEEITQVIGHLLNGGAS